MRRVIHHLILGLLVFGLVGPYVTPFWKMTVRALEETEEKSEEAEETPEASGPAFTLSGRTGHASRARAFSRRRAPGLARRSPGRRARLQPPAQVRAPRSTVVWRPCSPVPEDEPVCR